MLEIMHIRDPHLAGGAAPLLTWLTPRGIQVLSFVPPVPPCRLRQ